MTSISVRLRAFGLLHEHLSLELNAFADFEPVSMSCPGPNLSAASDAASIMLAPWCADSYAIGRSFFLDASCDFCSLPAACTQLKTQAIHQDVSVTAPHLCLFPEQLKRRFLIEDSNGAMLRVFSRKRALYLGTGAVCVCRVCHFPASRCSERSRG
jgi:hypothetical protein